MPFIDKLQNYILQKTRIIPTLQTDFFEERIFDSMGFILFVAYIETEFNIEIPEEDLTEENFRSLSQINNYLKMNFTDT